MNINELKEKFNLPIETTETGKSIDSPIKIKKGTKKYVELEYFIISHLLEMDDNFDYVREGQRLLSYKKKNIDLIKIKITDKKKSSVKYEEFYFDITEVY